MKALLSAVALMTLAGAAKAQELRPLCADRPGLGSPPCTIDAGHALVELGGVDWTLDKDDSAREDQIVAGDLLVRYGIAEDLEVDIGWTAFGRVRTRDRRTGEISRRSGTGDLLLGVKRNFANPDGSGLSVAAMPFATLPTGGEAIGAGDWGAGLIVPVSYSLGESLALQLAPEIDAAVDSDRRGRHLAYGSVVGIAADLTKSLTSALEFQAMRDEDPAERHTEALASLSLAWQPRDDLQFDVGAVAGLNAASPDVELYMGIARRF